MNAPLAPSRAELIERSLHGVAETVGDPAPQVYQRLFQLAPGVEPLFAADRSSSVRGEMLQRALETVNDLVAGVPYARGLIATEFQNHQQFGVPAAQFGLFFVAMVDTFRAALGERWDAATEGAWQSVLAQVAAITAPTV